ncbi:MAG: replicative DNA helicase [Bacilli bacterium]|jgi:replicative DNA helicase
MNSTRGVPYNNDAEMYVLGSIIIEPDLMNAVMGKLNEDDFYNPQNRNIYQAMLTLFKNQQPIEALTIIEELDRMKVAHTFDVRGYIVELVDTVPSTATTYLYIDTVKEKAVERELLKNFKELSEDILTNKYDFNTILDKTEDKLQDIIKKRKTSDFLTIEKAATVVYDQIEKYVGNKNEITGLATGFPRLDKATLGLQKGDLIILAARPSVGKSTFSLNLATNISEKNNAHVAFFSLEMSIEQLVMRLFSAKAYLKLSNIRNGFLNSKELIRLGHARQDLMKLNMYFDETSSSDINDIRAKCRKLKQADQLDAVVIDYLQLINVSGKRGNRQEEVSEISRNLKLLAKELDVPIVALSQLSRLVETRSDKRPVLSDLRESGSIEQDADIVMFLYPHSDVKEVSESIDTTEVEVDNDGEGQSRRIDLLIAKNRQGALSNIEYIFYGDECRFKEMRVKRPSTKKTSA